MNNAFITSWDDSTELDNEWHKHKGLRVTFVLFLAGWDEDSTGFYLVSSCIQGCRKNSVLLLLSWQQPHHWLQASLLQLQFKITV